MKNKFGIVNGIIYHDDKIYKNHTLLVVGQRIEAIVETKDMPADFEVVDAKGKNICPGFIDLQVYGAGDNLFSAEMDVASITTIQDRLMRQGCTSFHLTLATNTLELFKEAIELVKATPQLNLLGLHLEGPFLNPIKRGAHPSELIIPATVDNLKELIEGNEDFVKMITVAPELLSSECTVYLQTKDVVVSAGHSNATFQEATTAFEQGITAVTHLWNAMSPFNHRESGLPGAVFNHHSACASIIVDGVHVNYEVVKTSKALLKERLFLITDATAHTSKGTYQHILNGDHYVLPDGTLSGSALSMLKSVENSVKYADISLDEAIRMATLYPARLIQRADIGWFEGGSYANIVIFDHDFQVDAVFFEGIRID